MRLCNFLAMLCNANVMKGQHEAHKAGLENTRRQESAAHQECEGGFSGAG